MNPHNTTQNCVLIKTLFLQNFVIFSLKHTHYPHLSFSFPFTSIDPQYYCILLLPLEGHLPIEQRLSGADPEVVVVLVADGDLLACVARQADVLANRVGDHAPIAALAQQRVNRLQVVPVLLCGHLRQVGGRPLAAILIAELNANAMYAHRPVEIVVAVFEVEQQRNADVQLVELLLANRLEAAVS